VGDEGDKTIIGQASYAMAASFDGADAGINPDPANGGVQDGVTYVVFKVFNGTRNVVDALEDTDQAKVLGAEAVNRLIASHGQ
jgi:hypothetical protein